MKTKFKVKSALKKRIKITKSGKIKRFEAARSHLRRNKRTRKKQMLNLSKADGKLIRQGFGKE